jgi:hypothetical protein
MMMQRRNYHLQKHDRRLLVTWRELQEKFVKIWPETPFIYRLELMLRWNIWRD